MLHYSPNEADSHFSIDIREAKRTYDVGDVVARIKGRVIYTSDGNGQDEEAMRKDMVDRANLYLAARPLLLAAEATVCGACHNRIGFSGEIVQDKSWNANHRFDYHTCTSCRPLRIAIAIARQGETRASEEETLGWIDDQVGSI